AEVLQHHQGARGIGRVVGQGDRRALRYRVQALVLLAVDRDRRGGHLDHFAELQPVVPGELAQVDDMLERVGVERPLGEREVRLDVVVELDDPNLVALLLEQGLDTDLHLVGVRTGRRTDDEFGLCLRDDGGGERRGQRDGGCKEGTAGDLHCRYCPESKGGVAATTTVDAGRAQRLSRRRATWLPRNWISCTRTTRMATVSTITSVWKR